MLLISKSSYFPNPRFLCERPFKPLMALSGYQVQELPRVILLLIETGTGGSVWMTMLAAVDDKINITGNALYLGEFQMIKIFSPKVKNHCE